MKLQFGLTAFDKASNAFPALPVVNMYAEEVPTEEGPVLLSRPGLGVRSTISNAPVEAVYASEGVFNSSLFAISGGQLYRNGGAEGAVYGSMPWSIDSYGEAVFFAGGSSLHYYYNNQLGLVGTPDGLSVSCLAVGASRVVIAEKNTGKFYWSEPLSASFGDLSFATAENAPDNILDILYVGDLLVLFGGETVEFWPSATGDPDLPFQPLTGRAFEVGIKCEGASAQIGSTFAWVTNRNAVCISTPENVVSNPSLEAKIAQEETVGVFNFFIDGTEFVAIRLTGETWVYNLRTGSWSTFATSGRGNWSAQCYANGVFGSAYAGNLLEWNGTFDDEGKELERKFRAWAALTSGSVVAHEISLRASTGTTDELAGNNTDPVIEMRSSRDSGNTWTNWRQKTLGRQGEYRKRVYWPACGMFSYSGVLLEFRTTATVPFSISSVLMNENIKGR